MNTIVEFFPGLREMENFHPLLVHFPIALLTCFLLLDFVGFITNRRVFVNTASWMLFLGTLGALATVTTGLDAALSVAHPDNVHEFLEKHRNYGFNVAGLALILSFWRLANRARFSRLGHAVHLLTAVLLVFNLFCGADLGGLMVYRYGVAVKAAQIKHSGHSHESVAGEFAEWWHHLIYGYHHHEHPH